MSSPAARRILFVDDDAYVLSGLRTRLRSMAGKWDMHFAEGGAQALAALESAPFDVVVSDARMPGLDGAQLLQIVQQRWPETVRIVLSGHADQELGLRFVAIAHQYLRKPCQAPQLDNAIERALRVRELLQSAPLRALIGMLRELPVLPRIFAELQSAMARDNVTTKEVAGIVSGDAAVTARVLQMANSAFYRRARRISSIEQAVTQLGFASLRNLVLCAEVFARWPQQPPGAPLDLEKMQRHTQAVAEAVHALTARTSLADDALLAARLHEIGYWVLVQQCPGDLARALDVALTRQLPMHEAEREVLGASHAEIGAYLLGIWGLPHSVVEAVAFHHCPDQVAHTEFDALGALAVARSLSGTDEADAFRGPLLRGVPMDAEKFAQMAAPFEWDEAVRRADEAREAQA
jgi:HD-like signal output (HDOD) protein/ActR/RegA family two-component response regulator